MTRIVIADDHPIVRDGLRRLLSRQPDLAVAGEAVDGADLVDVLGRTPCDVLVLDLSLPHIRGLELVRLVRERWPEVGIVAFTVQPEDRLAVHLVEAGLSGYVTKDVGAPQLLDAVRRVARGERVLSPQLHGRIALAGTAAGAPHESLSPRESQVFRLLLQGMSVRAIAGELEVQASTASNHLSRVRTKLGVENNGEVLLYALRAGLVE